MRHPYNLSLGFLLFYDWLPMLERLPAEDFKALLLSLIDRQRNGTPIPHFDNDLTQMFASVIEPTIIRRLEGQKNGLKSKEMAKASPQKTDLPDHLPEVPPPLSKAKQSKEEQSKAEQNKAKYSIAMSPSEAQLPKGQPAPAGAGTSAQARERQKQKWIALGFDEKNFDTDDFFTAALKRSYAIAEEEEGKENDRGAF